MILAREFRTISNRPAENTDLLFQVGNLARQFLASHGRQQSEERMRNPAYCVTVA